MKSLARIGSSATQSRTWTDTRLVQSCVGASDPCAASSADRRCKSSAGSPSWTDGTGRASYSVETAWQRRSNKTRPHPLNTSVTCLLRIPCPGSSLQRDPRWHTTAARYAVRLVRWSWTQQIGRASERYG